MMSVKNKKSKLSQKVVALAVACLFLINGISYALTPSGEATNLAVESRLNPFFEEHGLGFADRYAVAIAAAKLREINNTIGIRKSHIMDLNRLFSSGEVFIGTDTGERNLTDTRRAYNYVTFYFGEEKKPVEVRFVKDYATLTDDELSELGVRTEQDRKYFLSSGLPDVLPELAGVWFVAPERGRPGRSEASGRVLDAGETTDATEGIRVTQFDLKEDLIKKAAAMVEEDYNRAIQEKGYYVIGLATGSSPIALYRLLIDMAVEGRIDFRKMYTFNMDEYEGLLPEHTGDMTPENPGDPNISYRAFMYRHLFRPLYDAGCVDQEWINTRVNIFNTTPYDVSDDEAVREQKVLDMCQAYEDKIKELGGVDTWIGGVGKDGHIAFNEPRGIVKDKDGNTVVVDSHTTADSRSRRVYLTQDTIHSNLRYFLYQEPDDPSKGNRWVIAHNEGSPDERFEFVEPWTHQEFGARPITEEEARRVIPRSAFSIGIATYKDAKHQIILAMGLDKAGAIRDGVEGPRDNDCALSLLKDSTNCDLLVDTYAGSKLESAQKDNERRDGGESRREEADRIHAENLKFTPVIPDKTILCHIVADSILPAAQRNMLKRLEQGMRETKYREKIVSLSIDEMAGPDKYISEIERLKDRITRQYEGYNVEFTVACSDKEGLVQSLRDMDMNALAFAREGEGEIVQVEGILLALRALHSGNVDALLHVYRILTGKDVGAAPRDINQLARVMLFILPVRKIDLDSARDINELIRKNILTAA